MKKFLQLLFVFSVCVLTAFGFVACDQTTNPAEETPAEEITGGDQNPDNTTTPTNPNPVTPVEPPVTPAPHNHTYEEWYVVTAPTCTETGTKRRDCTGECEAYETKEIAATGHNTAITAETPATCEIDGSRTYTCTNGNCEHSYTDVIPATGHNYQHVETVNKTCTQDGYTLNRCSCGAEEYTNQQPATGHEFDANHQCEHCGFSQSPMENLVGSGWYWVDNTANTKWAIYIKTLEGNKGTYCAYKGSYTDGVFTADFSVEFNKYYGSFEIITTSNPDDGTETYQIKFEDDYIEEQIEEGNPNFQCSHIFTLTFSGNEATGEFTLTGTYRDEPDNTFKFIGYKVS